MLVCKKCGTIDDFYVIEKDVHKMAYCGSCDAWIKNIAYKPQQFYVGKYKGVELSKINDLSYLKWAKEKMSALSKPMIDAITDRIRTLENELR